MRCNLPFIGLRVSPVQHRSSAGTRLGACWRRVPVGGLALLGALWAGAAQSAPIDTLLTAMPELDATNAQVEVAADRLARRIETSRTVNGDTVNSAGDYRGAHLRAAVRIVDGLWLSGSLWQRDLSDGRDHFNYRSGTVSAQYRFNAPSTPDGKVPALALRLTAWGNRAASTTTTSPVKVPGAVLNSVTVNSPSDRQLQADLIGTWLLTPAIDLSAALGGGSLKLAYGGLAATTTRNGCNYDLAFSGNDIFGTLAGPCSASGGVIRQFLDRSGDYGVDVAREIAWHGRFVQAGLNAGWRSGPWALRGGYLFHAVQRDGVDAILADRGLPVQRHNHVVTLESNYQLTPWLGLLTQAHFSSKLFMHDLPVTYNSATSASFGSHTTVLSLGLRAAF